MGCEFAWPADVLLEVWERQQNNSEDCRVGCGVPEPTPPLTISSVLRAAAALCPRQRD
jgi:hypothetical protein